MAQKFDLKNSSRMQEATTPAYTKRVFLFVAFAMISVFWGVLRNRNGFSKLSSGLPKSACTLVSKAVFYANSKIWRSIKIAYWFLKSNLKKTLVIITVEGKTGRFKEHRYRRERSWVRFLGWSNRTLCRQPELPIVLGLFGLVRAELGPGFWKIVGLHSDRTPEQNRDFQGVIGFSRSLKLKLNDLREHLVASIASVWLWMRKTYFLFIKTSSKLKMVFLISALG